MQSLSSERVTVEVETACGRVRGLEHDTVTRFLGIPYATPPLGDLRWRPPIPPPAWKNTFDAFDFGNVCAQNCDCYPGFSLSSTTEDCLYLNVYTPSSTRPVNQRRPVMVWIHGGGLVIGASSEYDPTRLVSEGDVVIVSFNHRLNIFGFFSHPAINAEGHESGNYGIMDQQLALKWVQDNIEAFGGDASNVTIFGESAGGMSVCSHLVSPQSAGLFHKAICQSGGHVICSKFPTLEELEKDGIAFAEKAGCLGQTAAELRQLSTNEAMRANAVPKGTFATGAYRFGLMEDGIILPKGLREKFLTSQINKVPVLIGSNHDEFFWFQGMAEAATGTSVTVDRYAEAASHFFTQPVTPGGRPYTSIPKDEVENLLKLYPAVNYDNPSQALAAAIGDSGFINLGSRRAARMLRNTISSLFVYEFDVPDSPAVAWPKASFSYRSCHASELQYLFPLFPSGPETAHRAGPLSKPQQSLSTRMVQYWTTFAKYGTPNGPVDSATTTTPEWDVYDVEKDNVMLLEAPSPRMIVRWGERHHADFWDAHYS